MLGMQRFYNTEITYCLLYCAGDVATAMYELMVIQAFRPDRLVAAAVHLVEAVMGTSFMSSLEKDVDLASVVANEVMVSLFRLDNNYYMYALVVAKHVSWKYRTCPRIRIIWLVVLVQATSCLICVCIRVWCGVFMCVFMCVLLCVCCCVCAAAAAAAVFVCVCVCVCVCVVGEGRHSYSPVFSDRLWCQWSCWWSGNTTDQAVHSYCHWWVVALSLVSFVYFSCLGLFLSCLPGDLFSFWILACVQLTGTVNYEIAWDYRLGIDRL